MRKRSIAGLSLMLLLALGAAGSLAAMMVELSPAELRTRADVIVTGTVTGVTSQWDESHSTIFTDVAVSVERFDKGITARRLTVRVPGGEVGDIGMAVEDVPTFTPGQKASLHLARTSDRTVFELVGAGQGAVILGKPGLKYYSYSGYHRSPATCYYKVNLPSDWDAAIQVGDATWDAAGSPFRFYHAGTTTDTGSIYDGTNLVWRTDLGGSGILAQNTYWYNLRTKHVYENDIVFNTYYPWTTDGDPAAYDVQNIGTHEQGHCLVLNDLYKSYQSEMTMYGYADTSEIKKRTLEFGDIDGINYIY